MIDINQKKDFFKKKINYEDIKNDYNYSKN